ncbi:entericidin A/B family lipoprotein [Sphingomicrobium clamense]
MRIIDIIQQYALRSVLASRRGCATFCIGHATIGFSTAFSRHNNGRSIMVRKFFSTIAVGGLLVLSACNTVQGVGEDVESVGEAGEEAIN